MYESAESGVWRVALGVWGGPIWQHAVSIMENHLQTNKYKEIPRSLNNSRWCSTHILFVVFIQKNYLQRDAGNTKNVVIFTVFFIRAPGGDLLRKVPSVLMWHQQKNIFFLEDLAKMNLKTLNICVTMEKIHSGQAPTLFVLIWEM